MPLDFWNMTLLLASFSISWARYESTFCRTWSCMCGLWELSEFYSLVDWSLVTWLKKMVNSTGRIKLSYHKANRLCMHTETELPMTANTSCNCWISEANGLGLYLKSLLKCCYDCSDDPKKGQARLMPPPGIHLYDRINANRQNRLSFSSQIEVCQRFLSSY